MNHALREKVLTCLHTHHVMTVATTGLGGVWAAAVFYVNSDFTFYFLSAPTSRHSRNIANNPQIAVTIQADYKKWPDIKGVQFEGTAYQIQGTEKAGAIKNYGLKFPVVGNLQQAPLEIIKALSKIAWYKAVPSRLYFIDNSVGFGHRDEIFDV